MNDRSFTKLFSGIVTSSMWSENSDTRVVWITMLALCDRHGNVYIATPGLSRVANVSLDACRLAIDKFLAPDPDSRTPDFEGRRIEVIQGGWKVLNYQLYRAKMDEEERREYKRIHEKERRATAKQRGQSVDNRGQNGHIAEAEAEAEAESTPIPPKSSPPAPEVCVEKPFDKFWKAYPRKVGKDTALKVWDRKKCNPMVETILAAVELQKKSEQWLKEGGQFVPHPSTWLNRGGWQDEQPVSNGNGHKPESPTARRIGLEEERKRVENQYNSMEVQYDWDKTPEWKSKRKELRHRLEQIDEELGKLALVGA